MPTSVSTSSSTRWNGNYPEFHLTMHCYMCSLVTDALHLNEHEAARWLTADTLSSVNWLPADFALIPMIAQELSSHHPIH